MTTLRRAVLVLDLLGLVGCAVLAGLSLADDTSSTASVGVAVALLLAAPLLVSVVLAGLAGRNDSAPLTVLAALLTVGLLGLVGLQLAFGS